MKYILALGLVIATFASCSKDVLRGGGNIVTEERSTSSFNAVSTNGNAKIYISYAPEISVKVKGYSNLVAEYKTEVSNNTLKLHYRDDIYNVKNENIEVYITMPGFIALSSNGSSPIKATGVYHDANDLNIETSGNATISIQQMNAKNYTIKSSGNCDISTLGVKANTAKIDVSGNGNVTLSVKDKLDVHISGNGKVQYNGDPSDLTTEISGNGKVVKL